MKPPPQCKICADYWINEGRPVGHYLIVSRGGHIPGSHEELRPAPLQCRTCAEYWVKEGQPRDHYLIVSGGGHIPGVHDDAHFIQIRDEAACPSEICGTNAELVNKIKKLEVKVDKLLAHIAELSVGSSSEISGNNKSWSS